MKISSLYTLLINRFRINEKIQPRSGEQPCPPLAAQSDRSELSRLVAALQEAERLEDHQDPLQAARLNQLEEKINTGDYKVDIYKLAEAMLKPPGDKTS
ncbi:MAG TPA: hypothetical protein GX693_05215 [Firmicutes bacterium]|nr:hypothetical protein [Bacillota bacterium]